MRNHTTNTSKVCRYLPISLCFLLTAQVQAQRVPPDAQVLQAVRQMISDAGRSRGGTVNVLGVRRTTDGGAEADLSFENFKFVEASGLSGEMISTHTGPGVARIPRYSDGFYLIRVEWADLHVMGKIKIDASQPTASIQPGTNPPRAKDGELDARSKERIRKNLNPRDPDPWLANRTATIGPAKDNKSWAIISGKCRADLTMTDTQGFMACKTGQSVRVRIEFELFFANDGQSFEPGRFLSIKQLEP